ncbi:sulfite exporter TauE/SafE family protein [Ruminococcaceae bacterium OttesenSCG-928-L11]|nr:sulfite exporter TauE/SafE family protein [Ruminococcaceae bacterium OttesenSCG-928-L11]
MNWIVPFVLSLICAALSALGMGGGGILLLYLTAYAGMEQRSAQGINLVFFVPIALVAILLHSRRGLIRWRVTLKCILPAAIGVFLGWKLAMVLDSTLLSKLFGGFLLVIGIRELFLTPRAASPPEKK